MSQTIIKTENLCYQSGRRFLVDHINWEVKKGEHWLVFGLNGCGKTTLLSMIAGFRSPTSGGVTVLGQAFGNENILKLRQKIGWVSSSFFDKYYSQESALNIVLSGLSGTFGLDPRAITNQQIRQARAILQELRMGNFMNTPFNLMSKGERQNILIARALIAQPEVLILDEPCTGLDIYAQAHMIDTINQLAMNTSTTIIYVTHQPEEIRPFLNKTLLLRNGKIFAKGDTKDMISSDILSDLLRQSVSACWHKNGRLTLDIQAPSRISTLCYPQVIQ